MQNYYIRIEDMPSLVSHQLSIIKYVVLKKIFFFLCFDHLIWTWTWTWNRTSLDSDLTRTQTSLDLDLTRTQTSLDLDLTRTRTSLDLDLSWTRQRWTWLQPYFSVTWSFRNHHDLLSMLETVVLLFTVFGYFPTSAYCACAHQYCILFLTLNNNI